MCLNGINLIVRNIFQGLLDSPDTFLAFKSQGYKTSSPVTAPAPTFAAAVSPAPAATAEPKKITMEEAQKGQG